MNFIINNYLWTVLVFAQYFTVAYLSFRAQQQQTFNSLLAVYLVGILPTWTIITKYSKDIALMGFVFDFMIALGWSLGVVMFQGKQFGFNQYLGILLMFTGIMVFKK